MKKLGETGVVDALLPRPLPPTTYARLGDTLFFLMLILLAATGEVLRPRRSITG
jgi:apolipoprotein N-acyltransferase